MMSSRKSDARKRVFIESPQGPFQWVETEVMAGLIAQDERLVLVDDPDLAEVAVVNTHAVDEDAREESIDVILYWAQQKEDGQLQRLVVTGDLCQLHAPELAEDMPEVDMFLGTKSFVRVVEAIHGELAGNVLVEPGGFLMDHTTPRALWMSGATTCLQVAQGCGRARTFDRACERRGPLVSRPPGDILAEAHNLAAAGVRELILFAEDTALYGADLAQNTVPGSLLDLLRRMESEVRGVDWIRLLNVHPCDLSDALLEVMGNSEVILPYLDMPLWHVSSRVLGDMVPDAPLAALRQRVEQLRGMEDWVLRATFLVGYPGESDAEFQELYDWVEAVGFDAIDVLLFDLEDASPAAQRDGQVPYPVKQARRTALLDLQRDISLARNQRWVGDVTQVLVDGVSEEHDAVLVGRHYGQAPGCDGVVYLSFDEGGEFPDPGDMVEVEITQATPHDLAGVVLMPAADDA